MSRGHTLIVAAMPEEMAATRRALRRRADCRIAVIGETAPRAGRALEALLREDTRRILVIGVCGGLSPELAPCDLVVPVESADPDWLAALPAELGRRGRLVSIERVAVRAEDKRALAGTLGPDALAVDLESEALCEVARAHGKPCLVLRAASDTVDETMPAFVQRCFRKDGSMSRLRVVLAANVRPKRWKVLMAMRRRMRRCSEVLAGAAKVALACAPDAT